MWDTLKAWVVRKWTAPSLLERALLAEARVSALNERITYLMQDNARLREDLEAARTREIAAYQQTQTMTMDLVRPKRTTTSESSPTSQNVTPRTLDRWELKRAGMEGIQSFLRQQQVTEDGDLSDDTDDTD